MGKGKRVRAERAAKAHLRRQVEYTEGSFLGDMHEDDAPAVAQELLRRYREAYESGLKQCPHLEANPDQSALWVAPLPDLLACKACGPALTEEVIRRGLRQARCLACDKPAAVRPFGLAVSGVLLRGGVCGDCEPEDWQDR